MLNENASTIMCSRVLFTMFHQVEYLIVGAEQYSPT